MASVYARRRDSRGRRPRFESLQPRVALAAVVAAPDPPDHLAVDPCHAPIGPADTVLAAPARSAPTGPTRMGQVVPSSMT